MTLDRDRIGDSSQETRSDFLRAAPARAIAFIAILGQARAAFAREATGILMCDEVRKSQSLLAKGCEMEIEDEKLRAQFLESMRSTPAFEELAAQLPNAVDLSDKKLTVLYPGSGMHIAPVALPAQLMAANVIDQAEMIFTEIDQAFLPLLMQNLQMLSRLNPDFSAPVILTSTPLACADDGKEFQISLNYKGKPIMIRFLLNCSGNKWFRDEDLGKSKVFVGHDGPHTREGGSAAFLYQILRAKNGDLERKGIIIEDLTRSNLSAGRVPLWDEKRERPPYERQFDLELLGRFTRSKSPYGHRTGQQIGSCGCWPEVGYPGERSGVLLKLHKRISDELGAEDARTLIDIDIYGNCGGMAPGGIAWIDRKRIANGEESENIDSGNLLKSIIERGPKIIETLTKIDSRLSRGFICRVFQALLETVQAIYFSGVDDILIASENPGKFFEDLKNLITACKKVLQQTRSDMRVVHKSLRIVEDVFGRIEKMHIEVVDKGRRARELQDKFFAAHNPERDRGVQIFDVYRDEDVIRMNALNEVIESWDKATEHPHKKIWKTKMSLKKYGDTLFESFS